MNWLFPLIVFVVIAGWATRSALVQLRRAEANVRAMAQRLGLAVTERKILGYSADWELNGVVDGRAVRCWTYTTGSGKSRQSWCAVSVQPRVTGPLSFELQRQDLGTKLMEFFGTKEITVGDPAFDAAWFVRTNEPDFLRAALVPAIRAKFMAALAGGAKGHYTLKEGVVRYAERGGFYAEPLTARLEQQVPLLLDLADLAEVAAASKT